MHTRSIFIPLLACLLPPLASARDDVGAAVVLREADVELQFEDGTRHDVRFGRYGIEYWEPVVEHVKMGFALGYSQNDGRDPARPFDALSGHYGSLGVRADFPAGANLSLAGEVDLLFQRDRHGVPEFAFETRLRETRATFAPVLTVGPVQLAVGGSWRELDYREIVSREDGDSVRRAEAVDRSGAFAVLGLYTDNDGLIALRYDRGAEDGWSLRFERTFR